MNQKGTIERAYELARTGDYSLVGEIVKQLRREQCSSVDVHLSGALIKKQLLAEMAQARRRKADEAA